jgi:LysR family transcriptional regulator, glycine cleavage system transcriptional activator
MALIQTISFPSILSNTQTMPPRRLPPLHAVRAFEAAARHLSMSHAARELNVTPGAVSRHVRALEENVQAPLFVRRATGLELTPVGQALCDGAREALDRLEEVTTGVRLRHYRQLSIGVYGHFLSRALLPVMADLNRDHPELEIDFHAGTNPLDMLPTRFDAVIAVSGTGSQPGLIVRPLMPITTVAVAAPRRLGKGPVDFARVPLLHTRPRSDDWRRWLDHAGLLAVPVRGGSTFESASHTLEAVAADLGLGIAIEGLLGPDLQIGRVAIAHPIRRPTRRHFTLQYDVRFAADPSLAVFADWLSRTLDVDRTYPP